MNRRLSSGLLAFVFFALPAFAARPITLDEIVKYKGMDAVSISPDGRRAAVVVSEMDFDENVIRTNLYLVESSGKSAVKLTNAPKHDDTPRWSPDGKWLAFLSDRDAKPKKETEDRPRKQVWVMSPEGGEAWQLTRGTFSVSTFEWAPDGKRIAFIATEGPTDEEERKRKNKDDAQLVDHDIKMGRIYLATVPEGQSEMLYAGAGHVTAISWSPRGDEIAFAEQPTPKVPDMLHSAVRVLALANKQVRDLAADSQFSYSGPKWSPNGRSIAYEGASQTDWWGNSYIYLSPAAGGTSQRLSKDFDEEIRQFEWADDSGSVYFIGAKGVDQYVLRVTLDGKVSVVDSRPGLSRQISIANGNMAWLHESPSEPVDVFFASLGGAGKLLKGTFKVSPRKVSSMNPFVADLALGKTEVVKWKNKTDGQELDGLLLTPSDYGPGKPYPLLLVIHGGPAGSFQTSFTLRRGAYPVQAFASQGYVVFMPNPRGSGGYGERFRKANIKDWGYSDYNDIQDGVNELVARGVADKDRLGVMGWSYGGFMTSWTITQTQRFKAASVGAGVTNLFSMYGTTDIPPFQESYFGARPWEDRELYAKHSAMSYVDKVTTPTLIQHGTEDRRVPISQGEELYTALRSRGVTVEMVKYPRSQHGLSEPKLIRDSMMRNLDWFDRYVMGNAAAAKWAAGK
jgi:dipeptidyl aminopeptidase/acylaminoacyl peptidase